MSLGLKQHLIGPTHEGGHTLDLVITRQYDQVIKSAPMIDGFISDHAAVLCQLNSVKPCTAAKEISYRQLKSIDMDALRADLTTSELCTNVFTDLDTMVSCYNSTLSSLLDKYAPLRLLLSLPLTVITPSCCDHGVFLPVFTVITECDHAIIFTGVYLKVKTPTIVNSKHPYIRVYPDNFCFYIWHN